MNFDPEPRTPALPDLNAVKLVYLLYFVGFFLPICALAGVILAYVKQGEAGPVAASHFTFLIRSFWMGLGAVAIGMVLMFVLVGWFVFVAWAVWALVRFITGALAVMEGRSVRDPESWGFTA
jgi:uncharacterized membrane protein